MCATTVTRSIHYVIILERIGVIHDVARFPAICGHGILRGGGGCNVRRHALAQALDGFRALLDDLGRAPLGDVLRLWMNVEEGGDLDSALLKVPL